MTDGPEHLLLWQPPASGRQVLQQFLRTKAALTALEGKGKGVVAALRNDLTAGHHVEIGGYRLSPAVAVGMEAAAWLPPPRAGHAALLELAIDASSDSLSPVALGVIKPWRDAGWSTSARACVGPAFWQTTEIEMAPTWIATTCGLLANAVAGTR